MRKRISCIVILLLIIISLSSALAPISAITSNPSSSPEISNTLQQKRTARFLNMLNHNFVYNNDFNCVDTIINNSALAMLNFSDDDGFIPESYIRNFVDNMYGIEISDMSGLNAEFPYREGYVFVIPRGYSEYKHSFVSCTRNEDGTWLLTTNVSVYSHDSKDAETYKAVTLFVENSASDWGYNIVYSNIIYAPSAA